MLEELFTDENSTGEEVRVWPLNIQTTFFACHLNCHSSYFHVFMEMQRFLFSHCVFGLYCFGNIFEEASLQAVTNEVYQMSFHDETATSVENTALFLGEILSLGLCYGEPTLFLFFILAFNRGGRFRGVYIFFF